MSKSTNAIKQWILNHDNSWAFIISYIVLAVVLSIWISLFWLVVVVAAHGALEWICQKEEDAETMGVIARVLWELKLDVGLIIFALSLGVYMEVILGMAGLSAVARGGAQTVKGGARFAAWQNVLRGTLLSVDDAAQVVRMVGARSNSNKTDEIDVMVGPDITDTVVEPGPPPSKWGGWVETWSKGDWFSLGFGAVCAALIVLGPVFTEHGFADIFRIMAEELHPWPGPEDS